MIIVGFYSVRDVVADKYFPPFQARTDGEAVRLMRESIQPETRLFVYPQDYMLYRIGSMDMIAGLIEGHSPEWVANISSLLDGPYPTSEGSKDHGTEDETASVGDDPAVLGSSDGEHSA